MYLHTYLLTVGRSDVYVQPESKFVWTGVICNVTAINTIVQLLEFRQISAPKISYEMFSFKAGRFAIENVADDK